MTSFWRYRRVAKGPQGEHYKLNISSPKDPTALIEFRDPAFTNTAVGLKLSHFGKPRSGQATDMSPSPGKLLRLGEDIHSAEKEMARLGTDEADKKLRTKISGK